MFSLVFALIFIGLAGLLALAIYGLGLAIKKQANKPEKKFFAPIPRSGSFSFVTLEGKVTKTISNVAGWGLNRDNLFELKKVLEEKSVLKEPGFLEKKLGVVWIGFFKTIKVFKDWAWIEYKQTKTEEGKELKDSAYNVVTRRGDVSEFFFQFPYTVIADGAEIQGNIQVKITSVFTVLHLHPIRAFFLNKDPVALFNAMIQSTFRTYVRDKTFDEVKAIVASADTTTSEFWTVLKELNGIEFGLDGNPNYDESRINPLGLFGKLGFAVVRGEVVQIEAVGEAAKAIEAQRLAELRGDAEIAKAQKEAEAKIEEAKGDAIAMNIRREARREWVRDTIVAPTGGPGPQVANVLEAEQIASPTSKVTTWVKGGGAVISVPTKDSSK